MTDDPRYFEWLSDQLKDEASAKRAGFGDVDAWAQEMAELTAEVKADNDAHLSNHDWIFRRMEIYRGKL